MNTSRVIVAMYGLRKTNWFGCRPGSPLQRNCGTKFAALSTSCRFNSALVSPLPDYLVGKSSDCSSDPDHASAESTRVTPCDRHTMGLVVEAQRPRSRLGVTNRAKALSRISLCATSARARSERAGFSGESGPVRARIRRPVPHRPRPRDFPGPRVPVPAGRLSLYGQWDRSATRV
jgi:hypothetical protein